MSISNPTCQHHLINNEDMTCFAPGPEAWLDQLDKPVVLRIHGDRLIPVRDSH